MTSRKTHYLLFFFLIFFLIILKSHAAIKAVTTVSYYEKSPSGAFRIREHQENKNDGLRLGSCDSEWQYIQQYQLLHEDCRFYTWMERAFVRFDEPTLIRTADSQFRDPHTGVRLQPRYSILKSLLIGPSFDEFINLVIDGGMLALSVYAMMDPASTTLAGTAFYAWEGAGYSTVLTAIQAKEGLSGMNSLYNIYKDLMQFEDRAVQGQQWIQIDRSTPKMDRVTLTFNAEKRGSPIDYINVISSLPNGRNPFLNAHGKTMIEREAERIMDGGDFADVRVHLYPKNMPKGDYFVQFATKEKDCRSCLSITHSINVKIYRSCYKEGLVPDGNGDCKLPTPGTFYAQKFCPINYKPDSQNKNCIPTVCFGREVGIPTTGNIERIFNTGEAYGIYSCIPGVDQDHGASWSGRCKDSWQFVNASAQCEMCPVGELMDPQNPNQCRAPGYAHAPTGAIEKSNCQEISGWSEDSDQPLVPVEVDVYVDGPRGRGKFIGKAKNNFGRGVLKNSFTFSLPNEYRASTHKYFFYALDKFVPSWQTLINPEGLLLKCITTTTTSGGSGGGGTN